MKVASKHVQTTLTKELFEVFKLAALRQEMTASDLIRLSIVEYLKTHQFIKEDFDYGTTCKTGKKD